MAGHFFQRVHRVFRANDLHHFNFIELVHTDQTTGITTVRTCFRTEARRMRGHFDRQRIFVNDFVANQVGQRNFCRWDQRIVAAVSFFIQRTGVEQIASKFRQLPCSVQRVMVNQIRNVVFAVTMLFGMQIQHELRQRTVHARDLPFHHDETRAGQLNRSGKIKTRVHFTQGNVIAHFEIKLTRSTPTADFNVVIFIFTHRNVVRWQVRNGQRNVADLGL